MPTGLQLREIAERRLDEAVTLSSANRHDGAYYLAGYAVECALKAVICERMEYEVFNDKSEAMRPFRVHDLTKLVLYAGLSKKLANADPVVKTAFSIITDPNNGWSEQRRYEPTPCSDTRSNEFLQGVQTLITWIKLHW